MSISPGKLESRVLVLYTGGTIGMQSQNKVYVPVANYLLNAIHNDQSLNDKPYLEKHHRFEENLCVLPPVRGENRRILYHVIEYDPLLDSCNMSFMEWTRIAKSIHDSYESYDGFVILHGTDTLCYTASALSFMFEDLGKPIVLTGSQIPISEVRCDGRENLVGSLIIAGNYDIPEVTICFNSLLLRGNRTTKFDCAGLSAFESPNIPPLARMGIQVNVKWDAIFRSRVRSKVFVRYDLDHNIALLRIFPAIPRDCFRAFFQPPIRGVVLQTFGAGNMPSHRDDLIDVIQEAVSNGLIVVNCSQCLRGRVDPAYETGRILFDAGVLYGSDLTVEAALTKLAYVLGRADLSLYEKKALMSQNLRGELTVATESHIGRDHELVTRMAGCLNLTTTQELRLLRELMYPMLVCQAVCQGNIALLKSLKSGGAILTSVDHMRRTSLHYAAALGELEMVQFLLSEGVSVHTKCWLSKDTFCRADLFSPFRDNSNSTPLLEAIRGHHIAIVELLRKSGAHLTIEPLNLCVNLAMAAASNNLDAMKSWKAAEADLSVVDWEGRTALHVAASMGNQEMVSYLLDNGVSPFSTDHIGHSALDKALLNKHGGCAKLIRQFMANQANSADA